MSTFQWVPSNGQSLPANAVCGGNEAGVPQYVARGFIGSAVVPGKFMPASVEGVAGKCYVPHGCSEHVSVSRFEILVAPPGSFRWVKASGGDVKCGAVDGGHASSGERYFVGRAEHKGTVTVGKIHPSQRCCYIGYYGKEYKKKSYEVLVKNQSKCPPIRRRKPQVQAPQCSVC